MTEIIEQIPERSAKASLEARSVGIIWIAIKRATA